VPQLCNLIKSQSLQLCPTTYLRISFARGPGPWRSTELDTQSTSLIEGLAAPLVDTYLRVLVRHHLPRVRAPNTNGKRYEKSGLAQCPTRQLIASCEEIRQMLRKLSSFSQSSLSHDMIAALTRRGGSASTYLHASMHHHTLRLARLENFSLLSSGHSEPCAKQKSYPRLKAVSSNGSIDGSAQLTADSPQPASLLNFVCRFINDYYTHHHPCRKAKH
jgi:hypothetical protein